MRLNGKRRWTRLRGRSDDAIAHQLARPGFRGMGWRMKRTCVTCGGPVAKNPGVGRQRIYCSRPCADAGNNLRRTRGARCPGCGQVVREPTATKAALRSSARRFSQGEQLFAEISSLHSEVKRRSEALFSELERRLAMVSP
jgi:hypothetical protein